MSDKDIVEPRADIVDRLAMIDIGLHREAIAEIRRLRSEVSELREALAAMDAEMVVLYSGACRGDMEAAERFAVKSPAVQRARALLEGKE